LELDLSRTQGRFLEFYSGLDAGRANFGKQYGDFGGFLYVVLACPVINFQANLDGDPHLQVWVRVCIYSVAIKLMALLFA